MCGTVNHLSETGQFDLASDLANLASRLDFAREHLPKPYRDDAFEVVEALHRRAAELAGDRACEIYGNEEEREAVMAALAMPAPIGKLLVQYLGMFRPAQRNLSFDRVATLLNELLPMIAEAKIERNGRTWSAPQDYWRMALEEMLAKRDSLTLPLKSHGYLLTIIAGYSSKAEAAQESQSENTRAGRTQVGSVAAHKPVAAPVESKPRSPMPESARVALNQIKNGAQP